MSPQTARHGQAPATALPAGIVADDLTGATDSAVQFARDGWAARLALTAPSAGSARPGSIVAVVTDARAMPAAEARTATETAVSELLASGAERLFVKIDSTMRGSIPEQVAGALAGWSVSHPGAVAIVCSAYPAMGRTIEDGHILVNGEGVHLTSVGTDPVTPVSTSDLRELLPGSTHVALPGLEPAGASVEVDAGVLHSAIDAGARVISVDASTDTDLARLAAAINALGTQAIPVGAAGLAVAMSQVWSAPDTTPRVAADARRAVVVVSSLHDVSRTQAEYLCEHAGADQLRLLAPTLDEALHPETMGDWVARELADASPLPELIVIASPTDRPSAEFSGDRAAAELIADSLATITYRVLEHSPVDALMLLGGEGARAVLSRLGAEALLVRDAIREGIPLGSVEGGTADGLTVVTKAGGFGIPSTVYDIVTELIGPEGSEPREGSAS